MEVGHLAGTEPPLFGLQPLTKPHPGSSPEGTPPRASLPPPASGSPSSGLEPSGRGQALALMALWHLEAPTVGQGGPGGCSPHSPTHLPRACYPPMRGRPRVLPWLSPHTAR